MLAQQSELWSYLLAYVSIVVQACTTRLNTIQSNSNSMHDNQTPVKYFTNMKIEMVFLMEKAYSSLSICRITSYK